VRYSPLVASALAYDSDTSEAYTRLCCAGKRLPFSGGLRVVGSKTL